MFVVRHSILMDMEMFGIWILTVKPAWMCQIKAQ